MEGTPFGRYRLMELLGRGGMGEVWRAHDTQIGRTVAIKTLLPNFAQDEKFEQRFRREARLAALLENPHVVPIYDFGELEGRLYVVMRLINGDDLHTLLGAGPLEAERAVGIIEQIATALQAAHDSGLVHRDIKPSNILIADNDFAYLIDFGIARAAGETGLTSTGATIGTWSYMAPERFTTGVAEAASDIYALACVLYQSLTGELPFPAVALEQIAVAHMTAVPPRPSARRAGIPAAMDDVIAAGMAKDPAERYATTKGLATAARAALKPPIALAADPAVTSTAPGESRTQPARNGGSPVARPEDATVLASRERRRDQPGEPTQVANVGVTPQLAGATSNSARATARRSRGMLIGATILLAVVIIVAITIGTSSNSSSPDRAAVAAQTSTVDPRTYLPSTFTTATTPADPLYGLSSYAPKDATCQPGRSPSISCDTGGQTTSLEFTRYSSLASLRDAFDLWAKGYFDQASCPGNAVTWNRPGASGPTGAIVCLSGVRYDGVPYPTMVWTYDDSLVLGYAKGRGKENIWDLWRWWTANYQ